MRTQGRAAGRVQRHVALASVLPLTLLTLLAALGPVAHAQQASWEMRVCADPSSLPFSALDRSGFENRIAAILADDLGAKLTYDWHIFNGDIVDTQLRNGACDMIMGVPDGFANLLTTVAYYQSPYVFVYRADAGFDIASLDDPVLSTLRIGVQSYGIPPHQALIRRKLLTNVVQVYGGDAGVPDHLRQVIDAVAAGDIDVGLAWGPVAGYFASREDVPLEVVPVTPEFDPPALVMSTPMTIAVRVGDDALRDRLNIALGDRWDEIQTVLEDYGVPREDVPRPVAGAGQR